MISFIFGLLLVGVVTFFSVGRDYNFYLQHHALVIVLGGTFAIFFLSTPGLVLRKFFSTLKYFFSHEKRISNEKLSLQSLSKDQHQSVSTQDPLINYACELWEQGVDHSLFIALLSQKKMELEEDLVDSVQALKNLSKYPPALGMTGTVIGMIELFSNLQDKSQIGGHIATAMTATFLGLAVANLFVLPLADRLHVRHINRKRFYNNVYQILLLINQKENVQIVENELSQRSVSA